MPRIIVTASTFLVMNLICIFNISPTFAESDLKVLWKKSTEWSFPHTPIVYRGFIYIVIEHGKLAVLDINNGEKIKDIIPPERGMYETLVVEGGILYLACENIMTAFNLEKGEIMWSTDVGPKGLSSGDEFMQWRITRPVVGKHLVYSGSRDGRIYALDKNSGKHQWAKSSGPHG